VELFSRSMSVRMECVGMSEKCEYKLVLFRRRQDQGERRKLQKVEFVLECLRPIRHGVCSIWRAGFREASKKVRSEFG
jgi:hypothetical protein